MKDRKHRRRSRHAHYAGPPGSPIEELAAQLAPPEERDAKLAAASRQGAGAIVVDTGALKMPSGLVQQKRESRFEIDRVVAVLAALMLLFTAFIAWQVTRMPSGDEPQPVRIVGPGEGR